MVQKQKLSRGPFGVFDLGSTKLACLILDRNAEGVPSVLGQAMHAADGVKSAEITDLDAFSFAMGKTVEAAEKEAHVTIKELHVVTSFGAPQLSRHFHEIDIIDPSVSRRDIRKLEMKLPGLHDDDDRRSMLHTQAYHYMLDGQTPVANPLGMQARSLGLAYAQLSMNRASHANILRSAHLNHLQIGSIHHSAAMAGLACLDDDMREVGSLLIDFGGSTTSVALYQDAHLHFAATIKLGGSHITRDVAKMLSLSTAEAEKLKALEGTVLPALVQKNEIVRPAFPQKGDNFVLAQSAHALDMLALPNGNEVERTLLAQIISARLEEILEQIDGHLKAAGFGEASRFRIMVTGGGSQLSGLADFLSDYFGKPVITSRPDGLTGLNDQISGGSFAASMGMAQFVCRTEDRQSGLTDSHTPSAGLFGRLKTWLHTHL